jgi:hypothetical protein
MDFSAYKSLEIVRMQPLGYRPRSQSFFHFSDSHDPDSLHLRRCSPKDADCSPEGPVPV